MKRQEEIRKVAYELYERSGMIAGHELENWLKAEKIVMARYAEETPTDTAPRPVKKATVKTKEAAPPKADAKKAGAKKPAAKKTTASRKTKTGDK
jgi:hypothetical protein